jgi:isoquinoline 1-oxidoreductase beta subunit
VSKGQISRRDALSLGGALIIGVALPTGAHRALAGTLRPDALLDPNAYVRIGADSSVRIIVKHIEFGQGSFTGIPTLVAEELDADWSQISSEAAPADFRLYANALMGSQGTGGSTSIAESFLQMRRAGAMARYMLVEAASRSWSVPAAEISVAKGVIGHAGSGKVGHFGEFAILAATIPPPQTVKLKDASRFSLIGIDRRGVRPDGIAKSTGRAVFGLDVSAKDMLTAVVKHPPRFGARVSSFSAENTLKVPGVVAVRQIPSGIAVYAHGTWPALKGRAALDVIWDETDAERQGSEDMIALYSALSAQPGALAGGTPISSTRDHRPGARRIEAVYAFPYLAHAPMEPLNGFIEWSGKSVSTRFGSQLQTSDQAAIARVLGITPQEVSIVTTFAGGSFGRRAQPGSPFASELAEVAKAMNPGKAIKLMWTREDDITGGYYRPIMVHRMTAVLANDAIASWSDSIVGQSFIRGTLFEKYIKDGVDSNMVEGSSTLLYDIPTFSCTVQISPCAIPILWWRSVGHTHSAYAVETFIDRLLEEMGKDPVSGRIELMAGAPRAIGVLKAVAALAADDGKPPKGRARGVAVVESFGTFVAQIAEVSVSDSGEPRVHRVWAGVDCGIAVNPDVVRAQLEGAIGFATGHALFAEVPVTQGAATVSNFADYRSLRIMEMPDVKVTIVPSTEPPTGIGEPGVPPCAPAIANALARLGVARPLRLPMVRPA